MDHNEIVAALEDLVPEINRTKNPQSVLIKYANEKNLSPAQLEKMGQVFNIVRTLSFMEKNSSNRGATFPLLDVPKMVAEYTKVETDEPTEKSASSNINITASERFPINFLRLSKGWQTPSEEPVIIEKEAAAEPEYSETDINNIEQIAFDYEEKYREKIASIVDLVLLGELDFEDFEKSARALYPEIEDVVFDTIAKKLSDYRGVTVKRASAMKGLATDITGKAGLAKEAYDALEMVRGAHALKKSAAVGQGAGTNTNTGTGNNPNQNPPPSPKRNKSFNLITVSDYTPNLSEKSQARAESILDTIIESTEGAGEAISLIGKAKDKNKKQKYLDDVMANTHAAANIQRLLITDPVISKADPETVISLAASLGAQNPSMISDINILRTVLREALQYEGVPLHTYKDILRMRTEELTGDKLERENEESSYGASSRKDK
jgi:hypothetical protein